MGLAPSRLVIAVFVAALLLVSACTPAPEPRSAAEGEPIQEAVIRYIICGPDGLPPEGNPVFFLEQRQAGKPVTPSASLLARLQDSGFRVRPIGERPGPEPVRLMPRERRESGPIVGVGDVVWQDDTHASVEGHFVVASLHGGGSLYVLERIDGRWRVVDVQGRWVS